MKNMSKYMIIFTEYIIGNEDATNQFCELCNTEAEVKEEVRKLEESPFTASFTVYRIGEYGLMTVVE